MTTIIHGTTTKPASSSRLVDFFDEHINEEGFLYIGYPIIGTVEGAYLIEALLVSKSKGLVVFNLVEGRDTDNYRDIQDDSYNKLESKLRAYKSLMSGRTLQVEINPITFAPARFDVEKISDADYLICNENNLNSCLEKFEWETPEYYEELVSVIQAVSKIRIGRKNRVVKEPESRGSKLQILEDSIANLDSNQNKAVIETVEGVQRIRGLAGSGKTIVLALKAAYLHAQHPDWKIAVTFQTRSLKAHFRKLINTFTFEHTNNEPDWNKLHIIHAWGAFGGSDKNGLYYKFCQLHGVDVHDYKSAKEIAGQSDAFKFACQQALDRIANPCFEYDAILIDEAQDFPPSFLRLCYEFLKPPKRLVYAYDELQNLSSESLPSPEKIFRNDEKGKPRVRFDMYKHNKPQQDVILNKCYRNSRPVLVAAHALGFGIYRKPTEDGETGLVQMFDHNQLWREIGYEVIDGKLTDGHEVTLARTGETSPEFLENHSPIEDLIQFHCFDSEKQQDDWVANSIKSNLTEDELLPSDIIVINSNPKLTRAKVGEIRKLLYENGINSHLAGVSTSPDIFFDADNESVVFTGVYRAKGNEAGLVYIINAQHCYSSYWQLAGVRNLLFTAMTRSKAWVRVVGVGDNMEKLKQEFEESKVNEFKLCFRYPTEEERSNLKIVHRDMTEDEHDQIQSKRENLVGLLDDLESGRVYLEDLGDDQLKRLRNLLQGVARDTNP